jgi:hypothetical protein
VDGHRRDPLSASGFAALVLRRGAGRLARTIAALAVVVGVAAAGVAGILWMGGWPSSSPAICADTATSVPINASGAPTADDEQRRNAAAIMTTGRRLQVPERGLWIALATSMQESGLRDLNYGDRDSPGLFQQRPSQGWGTPTQILKPDYAATQFFTRLVAVPDWATMPLWQAAQSVQRSAFPLAYAKWEQDAADLLAGIGTVVPGGDAVPCVSSGSVPAFTNVATGCVEDDPTTTNGCVTRYAILQAEAAFGGLRKGPMIRSAGCHAQRPANPTSDHPLGKGCDLFPGVAGRFTTGTDLSNGSRAAGWFRSNAEALWCPT